MSIKPLVSIIIATFNRVELLKQTLDSVKNQNYKFWECIVIDDGSTQNNIEIVKQYIDSDRRFHMYSRPSERPKGANSCRNYGFEKSKGDYIQFLDSDDCMSSNKIEVQVKSLIKQSLQTVAICKWARFSEEISNYEMVENMPYYKDLKSPKELLDIFGNSRTYIPSHCYLIHRKLAIIAGRWNEHLTINQDAEFFTRVLIEASNIIFLPEAICFYRFKTGDNVSLVSSLKKVQHKIDSWKLIEMYLKVKYKDTPCVYVEGAKWRYYNRFTKSYPSVIQQNKDFFKIQISHNLFRNKVLRKLKRWFNNLFL